MLELVKPPKKYRFRKLYFICENNQVINGIYEMVKAYRRKEYADSVRDGQERMAEDELSKYWAKNEKPIRIKKVEGFYLVHESLFDELLKDHSKDE